MAVETLQEGLRDMPLDVSATVPESADYPKTFYNPKHKHKKVVSDRPGEYIEFDNGVVTVWTREQERRVRAASGPYLFEPDLPEGTPDLEVEASQFRTRSSKAYMFELTRIGQQY